MTAKTYTTTEIQDQLADRLAATACPGDRTFAGRWWGRGETAERFYFGASAEIRKDGKPVRGIRVWLQFDDPATLEGVSLRVETPKAWYRQPLADCHAEAVHVAIELVDPEEAARLRSEVAASREADEPVGDLVAGEDD
ncbi:MAG: hypothetical protein GX547_16265 [Phycisphaerae bacterium]|nr:hypothetical protein [Phycisphaerae bacterium]